MLIFLWWSYVDSDPLWAKQLGGELPVGLNVITFRVRSPVSDLTAACNFTIEIFGIWWALKNKISPMELTILFIFLQIRKYHEWPTVHRLWLFSWNRASLHRWVHNPIHLKKNLVFFYGEYLYSCLIVMELLTDRDVERTYFYRQHWDRPAQQIQGLITFTFFCFLILSNQMTVTHLTYILNWPQLTNQNNNK